MVFYSPSMTFPRSVCWLPVVAVLLAGCGGVTVATAPEEEGDDPGECADDADNDSDGLFDCDDPDCAGADVCCPDGDGDGVCDDEDACPGADDALDSDGDGAADGCDPCPADAPDDSDGDGVCDSEDACEGFDDTQDGDGDGVADGCDPCPLDAEDDSDGDGVCDSADLCPDHDDGEDADGDGNPDGCDPCPDDVDDDSDGDGVCDGVDACPGYDDGLDTDGDGVADGCDPCRLDNPDDSDGDGVCDSLDACPGYDDTLDGDSDGVPDDCDLCPDDPADDSDGDGVCDSLDVCPGYDDTLDGDGDGVPDDCDPCPADAPDDSDGDTVCDSADVCPGVDDTWDLDGNGTPDGCDPDLVLYLPFDEGAGAVTADGAGNAHIGQLVGATWVPGLFSGGVEMDGIDDQVELGDILNGLTLPVSFCAWIEPDAGAPGDLAIVATDDVPGVYYGFWFQVHTSTMAPSVAYGDGTGDGPNDRRAFSATDPIPADTWTHLCAVVDGATQMAIYVDGVSVPGTHSGNGGPLVQSAGPLRVGAFQTWGPNQFDGVMDELRIYARAVTPAEAAALAIP